MVALNNSWKTGITTIKSICNFYKLHNITVTPKFFSMLTTGDKKDKKHLKKLVDYAKSMGLCDKDNLSNESNNNKKVETGYSSDEGAIDEYSSDEDGY